MKTLVPRKAMAELITLLGGRMSTLWSLPRTNRRSSSAWAARLLTSRQLTGQFPNYEAVLPKEHNKSVTVRYGRLSAAIQRVAQFADERSDAIRMRVEKNELKSRRPTQRPASRKIRSKPHTLAIPW